MRPLLLSIILAGLACIPQRSIAQDTLADYWLNNSVDSLNWNNIPSGVLMDKSYSPEDLSYFDGEGDSAMADWDVLTYLCITKPRGKPDLNISTLPTFTDSPTPDHAENPSFSFAAAPAGFYQVQEEQRNHHC